MVPGRLGSDSAPYGAGARGPQTVLCIDQSHDGPEVVVDGNVLVDPLDLERILPVGVDGDARGQADRGVGHDIARSGNHAIESALIATIRLELGKRGLHQRPDAPTPPAG